MTEQEFLALAAQGYNRIPLTAETFADLDTPLSLYLKLANEANTYLLESVQGGSVSGFISSSVCVPTPVSKSVAAACCC